MEVIKLNDNTAVNADVWLDTILKDSGLECISCDDSPTKIYIGRGIIVKVEKNTE